MNLRKTLSRFVAAVAEEADKNESFKRTLELALGVDSGTTARGGNGLSAGSARKGGRRAPAVLDPVDIAREGEEALRARLSSLDLEQLRDIVAQYGMDPGKLVMKWKDAKRVVERIVELALARATKGDAFRDE